MFRGRFVLITGFSGAGKSGALHSFEDLGFFCMDNLPPALIPKFAELCIQSGDKIKRVALVCDIRGGELFSGLFDALDRLEGMGFDYEVLFMEASEEILIRRYKETRRRHPLAEKGSIMEAIREERPLLEDIKGKADMIIDTSELAIADLKEKISRLYAPKQWEKNIIITVISFGYKYGLPLDADVVFDVRFLPNPYYVDSLRHLSGNEQSVHDYIWKWAITHRFFQKLKDMMEFLIPCYIKEGKPQLIIAIGCTGGRHRSVSLANELARVLAEDDFQAKAEHRDHDKV
ncbi:MAG: RNase adapter RapZ [Firmicutes bacterium]|nr:RNase adapter RapZ [Bacillota bacterium]